jgi:two-component system chemotaxis sensor kinase CheA
VDSGLGKSTPNYLLLVPVIAENETIGVVELASFKPFTNEIIDLFTLFTERAGEELNKYFKASN